jgi:hypothetical protein
LLRRTQSHAVAVVVTVRTAALHRGRQSEEEDRGGSKPSLARVEERQGREEKEPLHAGGCIAKDNGTTEEKLIRVAQPGLFNLEDQGQDVVAYEYVRFDHSQTPVLRWLCRQCVIL